MLKKIDLREKMSALKGTGQSVNPARRKRLTVIMSTMLAVVMLAGVVLVALPGSRVSAAEAAGVLNSLLGESMIPSAYTPVNVPAGTYIMDDTAFNKGEPTVSDGIASFDFHIFADIFSSGIHTCGNIAVNKLGWEVLGREAAPEFGSRQNHDVDSPKLSYVGDAKGWSPAATADYFVFGPELNVTGQKNGQMFMELNDGTTIMMGNDNNGKMLDKIYIENNGQPVTDDVQRFIDIEQELEDAEGYQRWLVWLMRQANNKNYTANKETITVTDSKGNQSTQTVQYLNYNDLVHFGPGGWGFGPGPGGTRLDFGKYNADTIIVDLDSYESFNFWTGKTEIVHNANALINGTVKMTGTEGKRIIFNVNLTRFPDGFAFGNTTMSADKLNNSEDSALHDNNILWNFYTVDGDYDKGVPRSYDKTITVGGTWVGTVLAPDATIECNAGLNGSIIANKVTTTCETHKSDYTGERILSDTTSVAVTKIWKDNPLVRPDYITLQLYRDNKVINTVQVRSADCTVSADGSTWVYKFDNLPATDAKGKTYQYEVTEVVPDGYEMSQLGNTIINSSDAVPESEANTYELKVIKTDGSAALPGATLVLTSDSGANLSGATVENASNINVTDNSVTFTTTATTDEKAAVVKGLPAGSYTVRESSAPAGYKLAAEAKVTLAGNGEVTIVDQPISVVINKYKGGDTYKDQLPGATFTLSSNWGSVLDDSMVSGAKEGSVSIASNVLAWTIGSEPITLTGIPAGSYTLTETAAPDGFDLAAPVTFVVNTDGTTTINWSPVDSVDIYNYLTPAVERTFDLTVTKTDGATAQPLAGAQMTLANVAGKDLSKATVGGVTVDQASGFTLSDSGSEISWTSGSSAVVFANLPEGNYVLTETSAPKGYELAPSISITLNANSSVTMEDAPIEMSISKKDSISGAELTGAALTLTAADANAVLSTSMVNVPGATASANTLSWTSNGTPAVFTRLPAGTYTLSETAAPDGYASAAAQTFTIDSYGNLSCTNNSANISGTTVTMYDTPVTLDIAKIFWNDSVGNTADVIENGETGILSGAKLKLSAVKSASDGTVVSLAQVTGSITVNNEGDGSITWTSGASANTLRGLPDGLYTLTELNPPAGFEQAKPITFTVTNGRITTASTDSPDKGDSVVVGTGNSAGTVTMCDRKEVTYPLNISKIDAAATGTDTAYLAGATLGIFPEGTTDFDEKNALVVFTSENAPKNLILYNGNYILKELSAPKGYDINSESICFNVNMGKVKITDVIPEETVAGTVGDFVFGVIDPNYTTFTQEFINTDITDIVKANGGQVPDKIVISHADKGEAVNSIYVDSYHIAYLDAEGKNISTLSSGKVANYSRVYASEQEAASATESFIVDTTDIDSYHIMKVQTGVPSSYEKAVLFFYPYYSGSTPVYSSLAEWQALGADVTVVYGSQTYDLESGSGGSTSAGGFTYGDAPIWDGQTGLYADITDIVKAKGAWPDSFSYTAPNGISSAYVMLVYGKSSVNHVFQNNISAADGKITADFSSVDASTYSTFAADADNKAYIFINSFTGADTINMDSYNPTLTFSSGNVVIEGESDGLKASDIDVTGGSNGEPVTIVLPNWPTPEEDRYIYSAELSKKDENGKLIKTGAASFLFYDEDGELLHLTGSNGTYKYSLGSDITFNFDAQGNSSTTTDPSYALTGLPVEIRYNLGALVEGLKIQLTISNTTEGTSIVLPEVTPTSTSGSWTDIDYTALNYEVGDTISFGVQQSYPDGSNPVSVGLSLVQPVQTNATTGKLNITGMQVGSYYAYETEAPANYKLSNERIDFVITEKDTRPVEITAVNESLTGSLTIVKNGDDGKTYSGAQFALYMTDTTYADTPQLVVLDICKDPITGEDVVGSYTCNGSGSYNKTGAWLTTGNDGQIKVTGLPLNKVYYAVEMAPAPGTTNPNGDKYLPQLAVGNATTEGTSYIDANKLYGVALGEDIDTYVPALTWTDTNDNGILDEAEKDSAQFSYSQQSITKYEDVITVSNIANTTSIAKVKEDNTTALPGAQLVLTPVDASVSLRSVSGTVVTGTVTGADSIVSDVTENVSVNAHNVVDETTGEVKSTWYNITWTSGIKPAILRGLPAGEYILSEVDAPEGYAIAADQRFTVAADGTVTGTDASGKTVTMKDELLSGTITLTKRDDTSNERMAGVSFTLSDGKKFVTAAGSDGVYTYTGTDTAGTVFTTGTDGTVTVTGLPFGEIYTFVEQTPAPVGYKVTANIPGVQLTATDLEKNIEVRNERDATADITVTKQDATSGEKLRGVVFELYSRKAGTGAAFVLEDTCTTNDNGQIIVENLAWDREYKLVEKTAAAGYDVNSVVYDSEDVTVTSGCFTVDRTTGNVAITATNSQFTSVKVIKEWNDNNNSELSRPASVSVQLYADGKPCGAAVELTAAEEWSYEWTNLPVVTEAGAPIRYTVDETVVPEGYSKTNVFDSDRGAHVITNSRGIETVSIPVTKVWDDSDNVELTRPASITIRVMNGDQEAASKVITAAEEWEWTFTGLPKYASGTEIQYTVTEDTVPGYQSKVEHKTDGYIVTNTYICETTGVSVTKVWDDNSNKANIRPASVSVQLKADNVASGDAVTLNAENQWTYKWEDLPLKKNGTLIDYTVEEAAVTGYTASYSETTANNFTITNVHRPETASVTISKQAINATTELAGAVLTLTPNSENISLAGVTDSLDTAEYSETTGSLSWESGTTANILSNLPVGEYTLTETTAPDGYEVEENIVFTVDSNGVVKIGQEVQNGGIVVMKDEPIVVNISKKAVNGTTELPGATLTLTPADEDADLSRVTSSIELTPSQTDNSVSWVSGDKENILTNLPAGVYTLTETTAPNGYEVTEEITFTVDNKGEVYISGTKQNGQLVLMEDAPIVVNISKKAVNGTTELPGATLTLTPADEDADISKVTSSIELTPSQTDNSVSWVSGDKANVLTNLPAGVYTLTETTAPNGYEVTEEITFTVDNKGEVYIDGKKQNGQIVLMEDAPIVVNISKKEINGTSELPGATLTLTPADKKADLSKVTSSIELTPSQKDNSVSWVSGDKANILTNLPAGVYTLTETTAPEGYKVTEDILFTVDENGEVYIDGKKQDGQLVLMQDEKLSASISFVKNGSLGKKLANAEFTLTDAKGTAVTATSDTNGVVKFDNLKNGTYTLTETKAPTGYSKSNQKVTVEITATGTIVWRDSSGYQIDAAKVAEIFTNAYIIQPSTPETGLNVGDKVNLSDKLETELKDVDLKWESSDDTIASVDQSGNVTINKGGTVTITATHNGNVVKSFVLGATDKQITTDGPSTGQEIVRISLYVSGALLGAFAVATAVIYGVKLRKREQE